ncbi:hypothetical protein Pcinc_029462 [Petrolisthes cinctipes]|uniref:LIM zinc-binding domain-containing protein n=1 Tax=Petrolisthes cinctipes TaxID=88211 RepID=A0AAE1K5N8_PETCI|nr:hypothetical protein Pcinc_029462 [Petrolisthes cinctipes]
MWQVMRGGGEGEAGFGSIAVGEGVTGVAGKGDAVVLGDDVAEPSRIETQQQDQQKDSDKNSSDGDLKGCGEVCQGCRDVIADRFLLRVNSRSWHQTCLRCCVCQLALDRQPSCFIREHNVYCKTDYTSTAKICDYKCPKKCDLELEPDIQKILHTSRDYEELEHVWKMWRNASGRPVRCQYKQFVHLANKAAQLNGFDNMGEMWLHPYESDSIRKDIADLWE